MLKRLSEGYSRYCDWYWRTRENGLRSPWLTFAIAALTTLMLCGIVIAQLTHQFEVSPKSLLVDAVMLASAAISWYQWRASLNNRPGSDESE